MKFDELTKLAYVQHEDLLDTINIMRLFIKSLKPYTYESKLNAKNRNS